MVTIQTLTEVTPPLSCIYNVAIANKEGILSDIYVVETCFSVQ